jgi:uncharacterized tellurite resistance protein B-like protein
LVQDKTDAGEVFRRMTSIIRRDCGPKECADLIAMLESVAAAEGKTDSLVRHDIARLADTLKRS